MKLVDDVCSDSPTPPEQVLLKETDLSLSLLTLLIFCFPQPSTSHSLILAVDLWLHWPAF